MLSIGFAGTAKNTGKTTAALAVLEQSQHAGLSLGLTSIGYDGEEIDHLTSLPKPRYYAPAGTLVTTAQGVLTSGSADLQLIEILDTNTLFGSVVLAEVVKPGSLVLVGPNHRAGLSSALQRLASRGAALTLVDGALNRLAPMAVCGGLILSTGAAYDQRIPMIAEHALALVRLFRLPVLDQPAAPPIDTISVAYTDGRSQSMAGSSLLTGSAALALGGKLGASVRRLELPGASTAEAVLHLIECAITRLAGAQLVFGSTLNLTAGKNTRGWLKVFNRAQNLGIRIFVRETLPLRGITVNPCYPQFTTRSGQYQYAQVDAQELIEAVSTRVSDVPVVNVLDKPQPDLLGLLDLKARGGIS